MTAPETADLRSMEDSRLRQELEDSHKELFNLRFQGATRQLADVSQVHKARRRIARVRTLLRERDLLAEYDARIAADGEPAAPAPVQDEPVEDATDATPEREPSEDGE